jgi:hypothetical protein
LARQVPRPLSGLILLGSCPVYAGAGKTLGKRKSG